MKRYIYQCLCYYFSGCSNDYLDVDQTESISTKDIALFNNDQGATTLLLLSIISFRL
jgi:hypothetical protein